MSLGDADTSGCGTPLGRGHRIRRRHDEIGGVAEVDVRAPRCSAWDRVHSGDRGVGSAEVQDVAGLPCSEPHDNEVYAVFDVSLDLFPGDESLFDLSTDACRKRFKNFVGKSYDDSILDMFAIYPTDESWSQLNDREVICAVYRVDYKKLTGSTKGSGI